MLRRGCRTKGNLQKCWQSISIEMHHHLTLFLKKRTKSLKRISVVLVDWNSVGVILIVIVVIVVVVIAVMIF